MTTISKSQTDLLGDRLRKGPVTEDDLRLLDRVRRTYSPGYEEVIVKIRTELDLEPTGRPAKSTSAIIEKLQRESIRLSQMQDIAGCRIVVADIVAQDAAVGSLSEMFPGSLVVDRRESPSHGYRAVHIIATARGVPIEIQTRTTLQHAWAELSEKFADVIDPSIKYGGGPSAFRETLTAWSNHIRRSEVLEMRSHGGYSKEIAELRTGLREDIEVLIETLEYLKE